MSEFEKWAIEYDFEITLNKISSSTYKEYETHCAWLGWQAATAVSDKRIAELTATIESQASEIEESKFIIKQTTTLLAEICLILKGKPPAKTLYGYQDLPKMVLELQANINVLREALEIAVEYQRSDVANFHSAYAGYEDEKHEQYDYDLKLVENALSSTPAQSLQAHDNEVIEQVVTILKDSAWGDGIIDMRVDDLIEYVRKLKEDEFPHSANLDIYNSVIFADAPYGTMIMESKIVKWLCRNRAKDYFDEMERINK